MHSNIAGRLLSLTSKFSPPYSRRLERVVTYCPLFTSAQLLHITDVVFTSGLLELTFSSCGSSLYSAKIPSKGEERSSSKHNRFPGSPKTSTNYNPCKLNVIKLVVGLYTCCCGILWSRRCYKWFIHVVAMCLLLDNFCLFASTVQHTAHVPFWCN